MRAIEFITELKKNLVPAKPRNPVAKNASATIGGGGAGSHTNKKKAAKQGIDKHKKSLSVQAAG
jgi:hypothetical protein